MRVLPRHPLPLLRTSSFVLAAAVVLVLGGCGGTKNPTVSVTAEPAGTHCPNGGVRVQVGSATPSYVCNAPGETDTTTALTSDTNPSVYGQSLVLTATVTAKAGSATGAVTFLDGANPLGTAALEGGKASLQVASLGAGTHALTAVFFDAKSAFASSTSASVSQVVNPATTATALTANAAQSDFGQPVVFTAKVTAVAPGAGTPTGSVTFMEGGNALGSAVLDATGTATFTGAFGASGAASVTAVYGGDADFAGSTSSAVSETIGTAATMTLLTSDTDPATYGQSVTFTATVTAAPPALGVPTGTVSFLDGATQLGQGTLDGTGSTTFLTSSLVPGTHTIVAIHSGDADFAGSQSSAVAEISTTAGAQVTLASSTNPSRPGQSVTFTTTIAVPDGLAAPTGTVTVMDGTTTLGTAPVDPNHTASFATDTLAVGTHSLTAVYSGDANYAGSTSAPLGQTVEANATTLELTSSENPSTFGDSITLSATVTTDSGAVPAGSVSFAKGTTTLGTATLDDTGVATLTLAKLTGGSHDLTATFDPGNGSTPASGTLTQVVNPAATTITLAAASPILFGEAATFTVQVTGPSSAPAVPTGSVTLFEGTSALASGLVDDTGTVTIDLTGLSVGTHSITAIYEGDADFAIAQSSAVSEEVDPGGTVVTLTMNPNPGITLQSMTWTATVRSTVPDAGTPTGTVYLHYSHNGDLGGIESSADLDGSGTATNSIHELPGAQTQHLVAVYPGDTNFAASTSAVEAEVINPTPAWLTLASDTTAPVFGQPVTFTVTPGASVLNPAQIGAFSGTITFMDGAVMLGDVIKLGGQPTPTFTTSALGLGTHAITAVFAGSSLFGPATSAKETVTVGQAATTVAVTSSENPSKLGQPVTFTATPAAAAPGAGSPTGTVTFSQAGTTMGMAAIGPDGSARVTYAGLAVGTSPVVATYSGDGNFTGSTSNPLAQIVQPSRTTITISTDLNPATYGQTVAFTATVAASAPGTGIPTGVVTFRDGTSILGVATLDSFGTATYQTAALTAGTHPIIVDYAGDSSFLASTSGAFSAVIDPAATMTTVSESPSSSAVVGQAVTLTATVTAVAPGQGVPRGTVSFGDGDTVFGTAPLDATGTATLATPAIYPALYVTASYVPTSDFLPSQSSRKWVRVYKTSPAITLVSNTNPAGSGQTVKLTATVSSTNALVTAVPTGTVTFKDGSTTLGTATLDATGATSISLATLSVASHSIQAHYSGDGTYYWADSDALTQVINTATTTVSLDSNALTSVAGQSVTFTATINTGGATPTGTVTFKDGTTTLGSASLSGGAATLTTDALSVGTHSITAAYGGDGTHSAATSGAISQVVKGAATAVTLTSSPNPSTYGEAVTFTATVAVTGNGSGTPTGTITFHDTQRAADVTATLDATGTATMTTSDLSVSDQHWTTASYSGDSNYNSSTSSALQQEVDLAPSTTTLAASPNPSTYAQAVTLTATVTSTGGTPTGSVVFADGGTTLGSGSLDASGKASLTTTALAGGSHSLTATYQASDTIAGSTSSAVALDVNTGATSTTLTTSPTTPSYDESVTLSATVRPAAMGSLAPTGTVTFSDGTTTLGTGTLDTKGGASLTVASLSPGSHTLTAVYGGDSNYQTSTSAEVGTTVTKGQISVAISSSPTTANVGTPVTFTITVTPTASGAATPTGTVSFTENGGTATELTLDATGTASVTRSDLVAGKNELLVSYDGDASYTGGASATYEQDMDQPTVTLAATDSTVQPPYHVAPGQTLSLTATLTSSASPDTDTIDWNLDAQAAGTLTGSPVVVHTATSITSTVTYQAPASAASVPDAVTASCGSTSVTASVQIDPPMRPGAQPFLNGQTMLTPMADFAVIGNSPVDEPLDKNDWVLDPASAHGKYDSSSNGESDQYLFVDGSSDFGSDRRKIAVSGNLDDDLQEETVVLSWDPTKIDPTNAVGTLSILDPSMKDGKVTYTRVTPQLLDGTTPMTLDPEPDCANPGRAWETPGCFGPYDYDVALADLDNDGYDEIIVTATIADAGMTKPGMLWIFDDMHNSGPGQLKLLQKYRLDGAPGSGTGNYNGVFIARVAAGTMRNDTSKQIAVAWIDSHDYRIGLNNATGIQQLDFQLFDAESSPFAPLGPVELTPLDTDAQTQKTNPIIAMSSDLTTNNLLGVALADVNGDGIDELVLAGWNTSTSDSGSVWINLQMLGNLTDVTSGTDRTALPLLAKGSSPVEIHVGGSPPPSRWLLPLADFASPATTSTTRVQNLIAGNHIASLYLDTTQNPAVPTVGWDVALPSHSSTINGVQYSADDKVHSLFDAPDYYYHDPTRDQALHYPTYRDVRAADVNGDGRDDVVMFRDDGSMLVLGWLLGSGTHPTLYWGPVYSRVGNPSAVEWLPNAILSPAAADADSTTIKYTGQHSIVYGSTQLIALLASPPVVTQGLLDDTGTCNPVQNNGWNTMTTFTSSSSTSNTNGGSVGVYGGFVVGADVEVSAGVGVQTKLSEWKATFTADAESTYTHDTTVEQEHGMHYSQAYGDDGVVFSTVPYDQFVYTIASDIDPKWVGKTITVSVPQPPRILLTDRTFFNQVVNPNSFHITSDLLKGTRGDLTTYPSFSDLDAASGTSASPIDLGNGYSVYPTIEALGEDPESPSEDNAPIGSTSQGSDTGVSYSVDYSTSNESETSLSIGFDGEWQLGTFLVGFSAGVTGGYYHSVSFSNGVSFEGAVGNVSSQDWDYGYRLYAYKETLTDSNGNAVQSFYVANYGVDPYGSAFTSPPSNVCTPSP